MSRVRTKLSRYRKSNGITKEYSLYSDFGGPDELLRDHQITEYLAPFFAPTIYESMTDTLGHGSVQSVIHDKIEWDVSGGFAIKCSYPAGSWTVVEIYSGDSLALLSMFGWSPSQLPSSSNDSIAWEPIDLTRIVFESTGKLAGEFYGLEFGKDVFNAILAAKKLDIRKTVKAAKAVLSRFRVSPATSVRGVKRVLSGTSNAFLAYNFGVAPLVDDMANIATSHLQWEVYRKSHSNHVAGWRKRSQSYKTTYDVPEVDFPLPIGEHEIKGLLTAQFSQSRLSDSVKENRNETIATFSQYLKSHLKLNDIVGLAWELVPFSFVADWFLHVDKRIQASKAWLERHGANPTQSKNQNISQKRFKVFRVQIYTDSTFPFNWAIEDSSFDIGSVNYTSYLRNIPHSEGLDLVSSTGFKSFQRLLSAALCWQWISGQLKKLK